ncbi:MAG: hypothetical protein EXR67_02895 [Dehalococcoidia bacterium]|nr:hypothetical protein [Dehalococcoidia bacterium]
MTTRGKTTNKKQLRERRAAYAAQASGKRTVLGLKSDRSTRNQAIDRAMDFVFRFHWDTLKELEEK